MDTARKPRRQPHHRHQRRPPGDVPGLEGPPLPARRGRRGDEKIATVIARIREDARSEPRRWLGEAEVKAGGE